MGDTALDPNHEPAIEHDAEEVARNKQAVRERDLARQRERDPSLWVGLEELGVITYHPNPSGKVRTRTLWMDNKSWEHTHFDGVGVWIYRHKP